MKYIKLFLASSLVEFAYEREALGNYIRTLNDIYVLQGIYFKLFICEDISNEIVKERKQEVYNEKIRESQFFYILLGRDAGDYTIEEFEVALKEFQEKGVPHIYTYFRQLPEGETASQNVLDFMERLDKKIGHYFNMFTHIDSIKLNILLELTRSEEVDGTLQFEDGNATLNGKAVLSLKNVPMYGRNAELQKKKEEKIKLDEEFVRLRLESIKDPQNDEIFNELMKISQQRNELTEQMHQIETNILDLYTTIAELKDSDRPLTWREKEAGKLLDAGDYEGALSILRDEERQKELAHAERIVENGKERIRGYISENRMRISALKSKGITQETIPEIKACYEESVKLAEKYQVEIEVLYDYAVFLQCQQEYPKAIRLTENLKKYYEVSKAGNYKRTSVDFLLASLYRNVTNFKEAEKLYVKVLETYRRWAEKKPSVYEKYVVRGCNGLARLLYIMNRLEEAEALFRESLIICRRLSEKKQTDYEETLALTCNGLYCVLSKKKNVLEWKEKERLIQECWDIYHRLAEENPGNYEKELAMVCNNFAAFLDDNREYKRAEKLYRESLDIYLRLAEENPSAYEADVAQGYKNLTAVLYHTDCLEEAEEVSREALKIYRRLEKEKPSIYEVKVADVCRNLSTILRYLGRKEEAEQFGRMALDIYRRLAKENLEVYGKTEAEICKDMRNLLRDMNRGREAAKFHEESKAIRQALGLREEEKLYKSYKTSLDIYHRLAEKYAVSYENQIVDVCNKIVDMLEKTDRLEEAEVFCREALDIYRRLAEKKPSVFGYKVSEYCNRLARISEKAKCFEEAVVFYEESLAMYCKLTELADEWKAPYYEWKKNCERETLANLLRNMGRIEAAEKLYER